MKQRTSLPTYVFVALTAAILATMALTGCCLPFAQNNEAPPPPEPQTQKTETNKQQDDDKVNKQTSFDVAIENVTFNPPPTQTNKMETYTDYFFDPTDEMTVTVTIINKGPGPAARLTAKATLYQTDTGDLPPETDANKVSEDEQTPANLESGDKSEVSFKFSGLNKFAQAYHLGYVVSIDAANDSDTENNEQRAYFWLLYGE